jgi:4-alpha-glucanotransferase
MALKRRVLGALARSFFRAHSSRREAFERWRAARPEAEDYARFRAVGERLRRPWPGWPAPLRDGTVGPGDFDEAARDYHLYAQWAAEGQLQALAEQARRAGPGLYLDLPLGVNGSGYDVWREREAFAVEASGGCPPDTVFLAGQDWGFPPLHPEGTRARGYRYVLAYVRRQLKYAGILRIDHMPVFHRLWWVPRGMSAKDGVYVRYPADELYALFSLESHRHRAMLVGEDLGTVPPEVPASMARHNVHRMYVIQYALTPDPKAALPPVPANSVASVNNHDMPPFAAYWSGADIGRREVLGLIGNADLDKERAQRRALCDALAALLRQAGRLGDVDDGPNVLRACLEYLAATGPRVTLVSLEDLWEETEPQNIPSTGEECGNWRRKARYSLEEFARLPAVAAVLGRINALVR